MSDTGSYIIIIIIIIIIMYNVYTRSNNVKNMYEITPQHFLSYV